MEKEIIKCKIPFMFPLVPNKNKIYFTKEAIDNVIKQLQNFPIVDKNNNAIGIFTNEFETIEEIDNITIIAEAKLWINCYPEIVVNKKENNTILDFNFSAGCLILE